MKTIEYYKRLSQIFFYYTRKKTRLPYLPVRLWVEPTSCCNLSCIMCPNKNLPREQKGFMDLDLFKKIIREASRFVFDVHLLHRGESLLHPDFFQMVRFAHDAGLITRFHTNGTLLDEDKAVRLIESGLDQFAFSFDGADRETYERIRARGDFDRTVGNIVRFLQIKKERRAKKPVTFIELINFPEVSSPEGRKKVRSFLQRFQGLPLDRLTIKEIHNWAGETGGVPRTSSFSRCTFLWQALIIFWDGSVLPCTQDFFGYYILGNVKDSSLTDIWNNDRMVSLRKKFVDGEISDLETCSRCDRIRRKQILGIPTEYLWRFLFKSMD